MLALTDVVGTEKQGSSKAMKGVNKGPGKAATNRAFADSDEDGGNHVALIRFPSLAL